MEMLPFLLKEIAPIRIFGQELFTFVFLYRLLITYPLKTFRYRMPRKPAISSGVPGTNQLPAGLSAFRS